MLDTARSRSTDSNRVSSRARGGRALSIEFSPPAKIGARSRNSRMRRGSPRSLALDSRIADSNSGFSAELVGIFQALPLSVSRSIPALFSLAIRTNAQLWANGTHVSRNVLIRSILTQFLISAERCADPCARSLGRSVTEISLVVHGKLNDTSVRGVSPQFFAFGSPLD